jgi:hypothetical protein
MARTLLGRIPTMIKASFLLPPEPERPWEVEDDGQLRARFIRLEMAFVGSFFVLAAASAYAFAVLLHKVAMAWHGPADALFSWNQEFVGYLAAGLPLGLGGSALIVERLERPILGAQFEAFRRYQRTRFDFPAKLAVGLAVFLVALAVGVGVLLADRYVHVCRDELVVNPFWGIGERRYRYDQVRAVAMHPCVRGADDKLRENIGYEVIFDDGQRVSLGGTEKTKLENRANARQAAEFISRRTGLPIDLELYRGGSEWRQ